MNNTAIADITGLRVRSDGFLTYVEQPENTGVYLAGCAVAPMNTYDTIASARNTAAMLINNATEGSVK